MTYLEGRKIVDEIIDGKKEVEVKGKIGALLDYLSDKKDKHSEEGEYRYERYEKLEKIKAPAPRPLWKCSDKEIECAKRFIKTEIPDLKDEGWDEESVLMHMVFCKRNELSLKDAEKKLLKRIFGDDEEGENNEDNA